MNDREELKKKLKGLCPSLQNLGLRGYQDTLADFITEQIRLALMVGQYQAADKLYSYLTTMWLFKSDKTPEIQKKHLPQVADDMLKACEAFMNDNNAAYKAYLAQRAPKPEKGQL